MADDNYALTFAEINQETRELSTASKTAALMVPTMSAAAPASNLDGGIAGLSLALADATSELRNLTAEQVPLRDVLGSIHAVLISQRSLQQSLNDRPALAGSAAVGAESKPSGANGATQPFKYLQPAINLDSAMARLGRVAGVEGDQRDALRVSLEKMAAERKVAAGGTTVLDLAGVMYAGVKGGVGSEQKNEAARQKDLSDFTRDTGITATAFEMKAPDVADLLIGWRTSMGLDRAKTLDLADATSVLGSRLSATVADIGSILSNYGASAKGAGLSPEQTAAFAAAMLNVNVNRADAGVALEKITTTLALGDNASVSQKAVIAQLDLDPKSLAAQMQGDAPGAILKVLEALKTKSPEQQASLAMTLFSIDQPVVKMLERSADVRGAFDLVKDKQQYASSARGEEGGAVNQAARALSDTSQTGWNIFTAQKDRLFSSAGAAVLADFDRLTGVMAWATDGLSSMAEESPELARTLILSIAGIKGVQVAGSMLAKGIRGTTSTIDNLKFVSTTAISWGSAALNGAKAWGGVALNNAKTWGSAGLNNAKTLGSVALDRAKYLTSGPGRSLVSQGARIGRVAGPLSMPLMMLNSGMDVVNGLLDADGKQTARGAGGLVGGVAGNYLGARVGAFLGAFAGPAGALVGGGVGGAAGTYYGNQWGSALGEKLATPAPNQLAPPVEVAKELPSAQTQNQQVTFSPLIQVTCPAPDTAEQIRTIIGQQLSGQFHGQFLPLLTNNPLATRRDAALTDGVD
ncbi:MULTISPECIES: phage tail tape measure protein [unclassified Pseudomonas]|uniref:phage tail tape measure protein n=1 Tax=unclassified Pseudomonas TaxID=196821 RepID=UPI002A363397|nr:MULTISPECIES: phage tail tape measure protein [unclassified Pseudomonas]MDX9673135.1 phage tail tape measure protein [Pseudomonas sp. P8_250]WPN38322.1 phage tail tape measure protein [Pseudomonas sp. P8_139]WPN39876.1 phage tail tape measure protein [Pseudomonas sp. P8_229]